MSATATPGATRQGPRHRRFATVALFLRMALIGAVAFVLLWLMGI